VKKYYYVFVEDALHERAAAFTITILFRSSRHQDVLQHNLSLQLLAAYWLLLNYNNSAASKVSNHWTTTTLDAKWTWHLSRLFQYLGKVPLASSETTVYCTCSCWRTQNAAWQYHWCCGEHTEQPDNPI